MSAELFLNTLFHDKPEGDYILIWEKRIDKKISYWFNQTEKAVKHFNKQGSLQDTYVGCGTSLAALPQFRRCKAAEISGIAAAWLDVDILDPVHSKPNLPETNFKAAEVIVPFPLKPTIVVHSGHGYQFWWVFDKFIKFNNQVEHDSAADLLHQFTWTMRDCARTMGYDLDMTFDLSRVFRIPGGKNFKDKPALPVIMEKCSEDYYTQEEFRNALISLRASLGENATPIESRKSVSKVVSMVTGEKFVMDPDAEPPQDKFEVLSELEPKFLATWEHKRRDFKSGDESASAYDLSLASFATLAGWERQEIVDLLIAFRRRNGLPPKLVEGYYRRTCDKAESVIRERQQFEELNEILQDNTLTNIDPNKTPEENEDAKEKARVAAKAALSTILKVNVLEILKFNIHPAEFKMITDQTSILIGGIKNLVDQPCFRRVFAEATGKYMPKMSETKWATVSTALMALWKETSAGEDTSTIGTVRSWLQGFLANHTPLYDPAEGIKAHRPYFHNGALYLAGPDLRHYVGLYEQEVINRKAMGIMLKEYGFTPLNHNVKLDSGWVSRSVWKIEIAKDPVVKSFVNEDMLRNASQQLLDEQEAEKQDTEAA